MELYGEYDTQHISYVLLWNTGTSTNLMSFCSYAFLVPSSYCNCNNSNLGGQLTDDQIEYFGSELFFQGDLIDETNIKVDFGVEYIVQTNLEYLRD